MKIEDEFAARLKGLMEGRSAPETNAEEMFLAGYEAAVKGDDILHAYSFFCDEIDDLDELHAYILGYGIGQKAIEEFDNEELPEGDVH